MMALLRCLALVLGCVGGTCAIAPALSAQQPPTAPDVVAFVHASVIPMDTERVLRDHTVVVANGRIVELGPTASVQVPDGALRVDATGRYLLPAFCDMHVHPLGEPWNAMLPPEAQLMSGDVPFERFLFPFVANGVTTVQVLSATPDHVPLRVQIIRGELRAPRLILARMIDGPDEAWPPPLSTWVNSAEEARAAVRAAHETGYDRIKVYSFLSREAYDAIIATAAELRMEVIGHIPMSISPEYVLGAGQTLIAHSEELLKHAGGDHSGERIEYYADLMAQHGVWMTPTLVTTRAILEYFADPEAHLARPEAVYFSHPMERGVWSFITGILYAPIPPAAREWLRDGFENFQRPLTTAFHSHGGRMMVGTDTPWPGLVAGFALHRELRELVDVGLTPFEALRTATTTPFEYLGENDRAGTIAVGMESDLVLLEANPLEDIAAAAGIAGVLMRGRWIGREEIDRTMTTLTLP
jgi:cytosine/adenosine deaminase-related metal-dependent hydrolase